MTEWYREFLGLDEGPPASGTLLLKDGDLLHAVTQHVQLTSFG